MPVTNNTDIFPQPGFVLVEHIDHKSGKLIQVPEHLRKNGQAEFTTHDDFSLIVLEDGDAGTNTKTSGPKPFLAPGTRVLSTNRDGFMHRGRRLILMPRETIVATMTPVPEAL